MSTRPGPASCHRATARLARACTDVSVSFFVDGRDSYYELSTV
jgi:hypothetical protein